MPVDSAILVKVDTTTKDRMKKANINWSAEIRSFIKSRLEAEANKNIALAVALTDKLFRKARTKNYNSTAVIRKFRDERHGPNSH